MRQCSTRWQVRQRSEWFAKITASTSCRISVTAGVSVRTAIPSETGVVHESGSPRIPSISTAQVRQPAYAGSPSR